MTKKTSELLDSFKPFIPISGSMSVDLNGIRFGKLTFNGNNVKIYLDKRSVKRSASTKVVDHIPERFKHLSFASYISDSLDRIGLHVLVRDESGDLMEMGRGVHSILGSTKLRLIHLLKYVR